jgi:hypothetical protein
MLLIHRAQSMTPMLIFITIMVTLTGILRQLLEQCFLKILPFQVRTSHYSLSASTHHFQSFHIASSRQRHSPYPMTPIREAMDLIFANTRVNPVQNLAVDDKLLGFVIAEPVFSAKDIPELPTTNVDGYAVRCKFSSD